MKITTRCITVFLIAVFCFSSYALANDTESVDENQNSIFDLSEAQQQINEIGIPIKKTVDAMGEEADRLYAEEKYAEAANAYSIFAKNANWLANIIVKTEEPYYSAAYDKRKDWYPAVISLSEIIALESLSNEYKAKRNIAMLREGLCYYSLQDYTTSLPLLLKALDVIDISQEAEWQEAIDAVIDIIGIPKGFHLLGQ